MEKRGRAEEKKWREKKIRQMKEKGKKKALNRR
jgi:hypothetical protein